MEQKTHGLTNRVCENLYAKRKFLLMWTRLSIHYSHRCIGNAWAYARYVLLLPMYICIIEYNVQMRIVVTREK